MASSIDLRNIDLPIQAVVPEIKLRLLSDQTVVLSAPPGAGKSTLLPLLLLDEPWLEGKKIIMLEPRRLAASSIAHHMATLLGEKTGETVGYRIRFESQVSLQTRIEVVTEGILTRMLHDDNALENVGLVIFDEFHERRIHTEVSLLLCRETQEVLRPDLRLLVMSATMDSLLLANSLGAQIIESTGRVFPVDIIYTSDIDPYKIGIECARIIVQAARAHEGDILAFLPGEAEIRKCEASLEAHRTHFEIHPLYGKLSHREQREAILPHPSGKRKLVLATAIAETSLTIEGIRIVVDSGYARTHTFDASSGLSRLKTVRVTEDMADQRAGRAGRMSAGVCYRMWTAATQYQLAPFRQPEILDADLAPTLLDLMQWGISAIDSLPWLTPPPVGHVSQAQETLTSIGALHDGKITAHGTRLNQLPCHPRIAHMLVKSTMDGRPPYFASLATDIAAILDERDPLDAATSVDIDLRITALRKHRKQRGQGKRFDNIERIARSYRKLIHAKEDNGFSDGYQSGLLLAYAYPKQIAQNQPGNKGLFKLANSRVAQLDPNDGLAHESWICIAQLDARSGTGRIFLAAAVDIQDLMEFTHTETSVVWDSQRQDVRAATVTRIGNIRVQEQTIQTPDPKQLLSAILAGIRQEGERLLTFDDETSHLQNRISCVRSWRPDENWPDVSTSNLLARPERWLTPYLNGVTKIAQLKQLKISEILYHELSYEQQQILEKIAPSHLNVPSGSTIRIHYDSQTNGPTLSVRLQELFGLQQTPTVNEGTIPVVIQLLSPGFKPVQVTTDLANFWRSTYFEVRKELKRRYPKHAWPADPLTAKPIHGVPKRAVK